MTGFVCWRCVKQEVEVPGDECDTCFEYEDRAQRKRASSERGTETHDRTHEKHRVSLTDGAVSRKSYEAWMNR